MPMFDTDVQKLKNRVLQEVATLAFDGALTAQTILSIPERIIPEGEPTLRCCIYKERAIIGERVKLALGGDSRNHNVVEVLPIACDECPVEGIMVSQACRGCIAHRCLNACPKGVISIVNRHAVIDKAKCVECGQCVRACSYSAIIKQTRPCINACKVKALSIDKASRKACIDEEKCISCGACVYQCPFGAISDKSYIAQAVEILRNSDQNRAYRTYAVVAPSVAGQYADVDVGRIFGAIRSLGFYDTIEAAWGADFVAWLEAQELAEKKFLTSSCCPAFASLVRKKYPALAENISHNLSPMAHIAMLLKQKEPTARVIFIGPCIAKKKETLHGPARDYVDCTITFEEMHAMFVARGIDLKRVEPYAPDRASYYGRVFARCGGLAEAVAQALEEQSVDQEQFRLKAVSCSGVSDCNAALLKASKGKLEENFIEDMAFSNALLGIVHSMAHKTGAAFAEYGAHIIHGAANAMYLPKVIAFNAKDETAAARYGEIADAMKLGGETNAEKVALLIACLRRMNDDLNIPQCISKYGADSYPCAQGFVPEKVFLEKLPEIAKNAIADACTGSNPRQPSQEEMEKLFKCCYYDTEVDF